MPERDGKRRRPAKGHLSVLPPVDPADDNDIRNRYNEAVRWEVLLLEPVNDWFLTLRKDDPLTADKVEECVVCGGDPAC